MGRTSAVMDASDEALMVRVAVGDSTALETLIHRYRKRVYGVLVRGVGRSADADDLFQETWIRVARRAATFDPTRPFAPWVARIAANLAIDWLRSNAKTILSDSDATFERASDARDPEQALSVKAAHREVASALANLPEPMRRAILLRYFE